MRPAQTRVSGLCAGRAGTNYPVGGQSNNVPIPSPSPDTTASSSTNGNPVNIKRAPRSVTKQSYD